MKLLTIAEYWKLGPKSQGYVTYMQAELPGSELKGLTNPYEKGSAARCAWDDGAVEAVLVAQDSEE